MNSTSRRTLRTAFPSALLSLLGLKAQAQTYTFGTASYSAPRINSTGVNPIITADLNADGIPDVLILGSIATGQVLSVFLGKPDASFDPRVDYSVQATGFTLGDFNGDGKLDV